MRSNSASDQRRSGRGTVEGRNRRRWRMRPALLVLEERTLLSTIVVNNPTDTPVAGQIDLRQALVQANSMGGAETISFDKTVFKTPQTITLTGTQLELSDTTGNETITGPTAGVTVSAGGLSRVFQVDPGVNASISGLTITRGKPATPPAGASALRRRRPGEPRGNGRAGQLHNQRQHLPHFRRRPGHLLRHNHADQLHRQRQRRPHFRRRRPI